MRKMIPFALCLLLVAGCGGRAKSDAKIDEMQAKIDALNQRVKIVEDDLLAARKEIVQQQAANQRVTERMQDMENYFAKLQVAQTTH